MVYDNSLSFGFEICRSIVDCGVGCEYVGPLGGDFSHDKDSGRVCPSAHHDNALQLVNVNIQMIVL